MGNSGKLLIKKKKGICDLNDDVFRTQVELRYSQTTLKHDSHLSEKSKHEPRTRHVNHTHILTRQNALQPLWNVQNIFLQRREHFSISLASSAIEAISRHRRQITKESAVNHKEIDTNGVNRMLLRRPWRTDQKNRFLDKVWTPQISTTPPKPFLLSFSTHLGDQTLARSIWKRSQLLDAFFRLAQGLQLCTVSCTGMYPVLLAVAPSHARDRWELRDDRRKLRDPCLANDRNLFRRKLMLSVRPPSFAKESCRYRGF